MLKKVFYICILTFLLLICESVIAFGGTINGNESRVIGAASGTFNYQGKQYVSTPESLSSLQSYLAQDDIDLTAEQADEAITIMFDNIQSGIESGYIVSIDSKGDSNTTDKNQAGTGERVAGETDLIKGTIEVEKGGKIIFFASTPIKNTGFSLNLTIVVCLVAVAGLIYGVAIICRQKLFNHEET